MIVDWAGIIFTFLIFTPSFSNIHHTACFVLVTQFVREFSANIVGTGLLLTLRLVSNPTIRIECLTCFIGPIEECNGFAGGYRKAIETIEGAEIGWGFKTIFSGIVTAKWLQIDALGMISVDCAIGKPLLAILIIGCSYKIVTSLGNTITLISCAFRVI